MPIPAIIGIIIGSLLLLGILMFISGAFFAAWMVYTHTLVRREGKTWGRQISEPDNKELQVMWDEGIKWATANESYKKEVSIISFDNLKLVAEYYDFGFDKTVIIMPGRRECLIYSYFYAVPYKDAGVNVLVIDQRAHGLSEGKYSTCGILEAKDVIDWAKFLHEKYNQNTIYLHGVCVGTVCTVNVLRDKECPSYIKAGILDSAPISYKEIFGNHMIELGHRLWPTFPIIWWYFKKKTHTNINESQPLKYINEVKQPLCFIHGKKDAYCLPNKTEWLFDKANEPKEIHWFEDGTHSKVRLANPKEYDSVVTEFIKNN